MKMYYFSYETLIGDITICANTGAVTGLCFGGCFDAHDESKVEDGQKIDSRIIKEAFAQLTEYLDGSRKKFDLKFEYDGSDFQMSVWSQLKKIPYGKTKTYKEIAHNINKPKASLAVGGACGKNPIPIFIPCHRVIGSNGNLTGYAGGIDLKRKLLEIENCDKCN